MNRNQLYEVVKTKGLENVIKERTKKMYTQCSNSVLEELVSEFTSASKNSSEKEMQKISSSEKEIDELNASIKDNDKSADEMVAEIGRRVEEMSRLKSEVQKKREEITKYVEFAKMVQEDGCRIIIPSENDITKDYNGRFVSVDKEITICEKFLFEFDKKIIVPLILREINKRTTKLNNEIDCITKKMRAL